MVFAQEEPALAGRAPKTSDATRPPAKADVHSVLAVYSGSPVTLKLSMIWQLDQSRNVQLQRPNS